MKDYKYLSSKLYQKNRKIIVALCEGKCQKCGADGKILHHKDFSKTNHNFENLIFVCFSCHYSLHKKQKKEIHCINGQLIWY